MPTTEKLVYPEGSFPPKSASWWASGPSLVKVKNTKYKIQISKYKYKMVGVWALSGQGKISPTLIKNRKSSGESCFFFQFLFVDGLCHHKCYPGRWWWHSEPAESSGITCSTAHLMSSSFIFVLKLYSLSPSLFYMISGLSKMERKTKAASTLQDLPQSETFWHLEAW